METARRLVMFSAVGAIGIVVQLAVLASLTALHVNYLLATGVAVEMAVIHNFLWHERMTWADRGRQQSSRRWWRFQVSNGAISVFGSLLLMRWLVGGMKLSVMVANVLTIAICAAGNFLASDRWVFSVPQSGGARTVAHEQQRALGERHINESCGGSQGEAQPDLWRQQKRRERPKFVDQERDGEQAEKFSSEVFEVEGDGG